MPRSSAVVVEQNFSKGLITEATAMNYPENAVVETDNCVYGKSGKVIRRYGINYEENFAVSSFSDMSIMASAVTPSDYYDDVVMVEYNWTTVSNDGTISFVVQQIGDRLVFFRIDDDNNISTQRKSFSVDLDTYLVTTPGDNVGQYTSVHECSFSSGLGYLVVVHPLCHPFRVEYDASADDINEYFIDIKTRDFTRLDDSLDADERPATLTDAHKYNLYNQGWYGTVIENGGTSVNPVTDWDTARTDFPSNADVWWLYKDTSDRFDTAQINKFAVGNTLAPNGHYIYSAFATDRDTSAGTTGLTESTSGDYRPSVVTFYAGRAWYSGVDATGFNSNIYFTKIIESGDDFGTCYQSNDPTSENNADLLPSDGGVIVIPEISKIINLVATQSSLYVFATNGLWKISGPNGIFTANDYSVAKISSASIKAKNSIVIAEGIPFWWDTAGIYMIQFDPNSGQETVVNISESTVQTVINEIPNDNFTNVKGTYNSIHKTLHWLYKSTAPANISDSYCYDKLIVLSLTNQSFSTQTISSSTPKIVGLIFSNLSNNDSLLAEEGASLVKFLTYGAIGTSGVYGITASQFNDNTYYDWKAYDGIGTSFDSYFITGYRVRGELLRKFQSNYISIVMKAETNSSCFIQGVWDYSNSPLTGRYTTTQQVYKSDATKDYTRRKLRIRGSGYSLQFKFSSEDGKPFTLIGWSTFDTGNNVP